MRKNKQYRCKCCAAKAVQEKRMKENTDKFKEQCKKVGLAYVLHFVEDNKSYVISKCQCNKSIKISSGDLGQYAKNNQTYLCKKCAQKKRGLESRISVEEIVKRCEAVSLQYITHDYINVYEDRSQVVVNVKCQCGESINNVRLSNITEKMKENKDYVCRKCGNEKLSELRTGWCPSEETRQKISKNLKGKYSGESHPNWKGGVSNIKRYLRNLPCVTEWCSMAREQVNYTCQLTGMRSRELFRGSLQVHHLYGFNLIVFDAHSTHGIEVKEQIGNYTAEELKLLEDYVASWHQDSSNAVVLSEEVHKLFHNNYGRGENTPEQYEEFKDRYLNGEFDTKLEEVA